MPTNQFFEAGTFHAIPRIITKSNKKKRVMADTGMHPNQLAQFIVECTVSSSDKKRDRAIFAILGVYGFRVSELLSIRKKDIQRFIKERTGLLDHVNIEVNTGKNRIQKRRSVPAYYPIYKTLLDLVFDYIDTEFQGGPEDRIFTIQRSWVWRLTKFYFGDQYSVHWFRHYGASYDARNGSASHMMMAKYGWADFKSASPYIHLNQVDVLRSQEKQYAEEQSRGIVSEEEFEEVKEKKLIL